MPNLCETCPIIIKAECCKVNPETNEFKLVKSRISGEIKSVCNYFGVDGNCEIYSQRPEICKIYECEDLYAEGLNSGN